MIYNFLLYDISLLPIGLMINTTLYNKYALNIAFYLLISTFYHDLHIRF